MDMNNVPKVESQWEGKLSENGYLGNDIAFLNSMKGMQDSDGALRVDRFVALICHTGKLQLELNMTTHTIRAGQILICHQNDTLSNTMQSPDFDGAVLSLSSKAVMEIFGESNLWDCFFHLANNPIIHAQPESLELLRVYFKAFYTKMAMGKTDFHKEIIISIIKAAFYELMENIEHPSSSNIKGLRHGEILFKQFMELLSGSVVKSRSVSWYANQLCITPKHLSTVCKQISGKTAFEWIHEYLLIDIRNLLKNSDKPVKEIVNLMRFPNVSFFGSFCRKHLGMSPTDYRKYLRTIANENHDTKQHEQHNNK